MYLAKKKRFFPTAGYTTLHCRLLGLKFAIFFLANIWTKTVKNWVAELFSIFGFKSTLFKGLFIKVRINLHILLQNHAWELASCESLYVHIKYYKIQLHCVMYVHGRTYSAVQCIYCTILYIFLCNTCLYQFF